MSNKVLIIVDMQNDFIDGPLGSEAAKSIIPNVIKLSDEFNNIVLTKDAHFPNYLETLEGKKLPITHCQFKTYGQEINESLISHIKERQNDDKSLSVDIINKSTFGTFGLKYKILKAIEKSKELVEIHICGLLTDICVISIAMILRTQYPNNEIFIHKDCCVGSNEDRHNAALLVADSCQMNIV